MRPKPELRKKLGGVNDIDRLAAAWGCPNQPQVARNSAATGAFAREGIGRWRAAGSRRGGRVAATPGAAGQGSTARYDAYYLKAQQVRRLLAEEFLKAFAEVDAIVTPTAPTAAFKLGEKTGDPLAMYLADIYTVTASLAGICGVTVPCGATKAGLPVGMQVLV